MTERANKTVNQEWHGRNGRNQSSCNESSCKCRSSNGTSLDEAKEVTFKTERAAAKINESVTATVNISFIEEPLNI